MAVISKDLGAVTAYAAAVNRGYTGTREEFETLMASYATVAQQAAQSAQSASSSAQGAFQAASSANNAMNNARTAESNAQSAASGAQGYAQYAQQSAQSASQSARSAESAKNTAVNAVDGFAVGAQQALDSVNSAGNNWKSLAQAKALDSEAYALGTRDGEDVGSSDPAYHNNAKWYAEQTATDRTAAQTAAQTATIKASEAQASASAAAESARTLTTDTTLTQSGQAADAKVVGDEIADLKSGLNYITTPSANLFDKSKLQQGYYRSDGSISTSQGQYSPEYVAVDSGDTYAFYPAFVSVSLIICEYDANKTFIQRTLISGASNLTYAAGSNVRYVRFAIPSGTMRDTFTFIHGTVPPIEYIPFIRTLNISPVFAKPIKNVDLNTFTQSGTFTFGGSSGVTNYPSSLNAGYLVNSYAGTNYAWYQLFVGYNEPDAIYVRCKQGANWSAWARVKSSDISVVQSTGSSSSSVMSQKAVTDYVTDYVSESTGECAKLVKSENLFNINGSIIDGEYLKGDGYSTHSDASSFYTEDFIPVDANAQYTWSKGNLGTIGVLKLMINTYDAAKESIERIVTYNTGDKFNTYTFGNNVAYVRISFFQEPIPDDFMFVKGNALPDVFIPYKRFMENSEISVWTYLLGKTNALWFGDSISFLRKLPHLVGKNIGVEIADCSIAGAPFYQFSNADYNKIGVYALITDKINNTLSEAYSAIDTIAAEHSWSAEAKQQRVDNIDHLYNADMSKITTVVILAGTNDYGDNVNLATFENGVELAVSALITAYPHIQIYIISPPYRGDLLVNASGNTLADFVAAEKRVAEKYAIPFYDLLHCGNINLQNKGYFLNNDQLHPSENGDSMLAQKCAKWLSSN